MSHYSKILIRPVVTEKMTALQETENKYAFEVPVNINKIDIKKAVEEKFNVKVSKKRAIVTLIDGYNIDLFSI